jgi:hypothetical protein
VLLHFITDVSFYAHVELLCLLQLQGVTHTMQHDGSVYIEKVTVQCPQS